jgi:5-oxoprolinase (ATP-hydrolysing)
VIKLLSVDPANYDDAPSEGIRRVLELVSATPIPRHTPIPKDLIDSIRMGTTVATNGELHGLDLCTRNTYTNAISFAQHF